ncbi:hypothetical protein [Hymenobacter cheonanensis]|uniref:hypothetical protein n=1 Tax=Hymenobacter sp. CA2-7 TaxID=3063993 RepID=UPI002714159A|nr:hypothetical protein [Hymenobacter sp. CA2-7]MDO7886297.1 hypothetical protein [Hymenobacter sp. CA2-7]
MQVRSKQAPAAGQADLGPGPAGPGPGRAFYALLALGLLGLSAGYAALVLYSARWPEVAALRDFYIWRPRAYSAAEFWGLRRALAGLALGAGALAAGLGLAPAGRAQLRALGQEVAGGVRGLRAGWRGLAPGQRRWAGGLLLGLTALRAYYSVVIAPGDDGVSYEVFVRARLLLLSAAYPMPNNHVGSSTLDWLFYQVNPGFWWSTRLPVLLVSTGATALWFLALLRRSNFRVAALAVSLFSVLQVSFYHAVTGRGYWLLVGLGAVGFFAVLELAAPAGAAVRRARAAWAGLVLSGALGLYIVPTHAYFLFSAYGWLGLAALRRRSGRALGRLVGLGALTLLGAGLLYAPLWLVSGPRLMFQNDYVLPLAPGAFWRGLPAYVWLTEGWLSGHRWLGPLPLLTGLAGLAVLWRRARAGRVPADLARLVQQLGPVSGWFLAAPYLLLSAQRVQAPERTLFYKSLFFCLLLGLVADWALRLAQRLGRAPALRLGLAGAGLLLAASQVGLVARYNYLQVRLWQNYRRPMAWLATQPLGPVLAPEPVHRLLLRFYAHTEFAQQPWQIDDRPRPGVHYRYLVSKPGAARVPGGPPVAGPPAFHGLADIFVAP